MKALFPSSSFPLVAFGACAEVVTGTTPARNKSEYWNGEVPFVTPKYLEKGYAINLTEESITKSGAEKCRILPPGSVLVSCIGSIGKVGLAGTYLATNQQINALIFDERIVVRGYGFHVAKCLKPLLESIAASTTLKIVNKKTFSKIQIPVPPLEEQKRIAAILDAADGLRTKRREAIAELDKFLQATFLDMFGDPVTNPKGWPVVTFGELMLSVNYGTSKKASLEAGRYPVLRMNNITYGGEWDFSSLKYIDLEEKELDKYLVYERQILFNRTNSKELVGKTAVYRLKKPMAFAGYLIRCQVNPSLAHAEFVGTFMNLPQTKRYLQLKCKNIVGMANINAKELQAIMMPKPPLELQQKFASIVEAVERQKARLRRHLAELDDLFASLQQRAFNGEL